MKPVVSRSGMMKPSKETPTANPEPNAPFVPGNEGGNLFVRFSIPKTAIQNKPLLSFRRKTNA